MLNAVIIVLREVLEAALIISVLLTSSQLIAHRRTWIISTLAIGMGAAFLYAWQLQWVSERFDDVGQEVLNASLQIAIFCALTIFNWRIMQIATHKAAPSSIALFGLMPALCVALAITREGSEIFIYLYGFKHSQEAWAPVLTGGAIGAGIGISVGALLYYVIIHTALKMRLWLVCGITTLIAAGMLSQAAQFLMQADILPAQLPLWDTSALLSENSVLGQLLYALVSYEATPTAIEVLTYWAGLGLLLMVQWLARQSSSAPAPRLESTFSQRP